MAKKINTQYDHLSIPLLGLVLESVSGAPGSGVVNGRVYYDSTALRTKVRENGAWVNVSQTGSELLANKDAAGGYPGLTGGKLAIGAIPTGSTGSTVPFGNDARFTDTRTPTDGTVTGGPAGTGVKIAAATITFDNIAAATITLAKMAASAADQAAATASLRTLGTGAAQAAAGNDSRLSDTRTPTAGSVVLASINAAIIDAAAGTASLRTLGATGTTAAAGNDARLSDTRTPTDNTVSTAKIQSGAVTDTQVAAANKDGAAGTASMRTLGFGAAQALSGTTRLDQIALPTSVVDLNGQRITGLAAPTQTSDAVRKADLDAATLGIDNKPSARLVGVAQRALTGLTAIDGVTPAGGDRVLLTAQTTPAENGIYVAAAGAWARAADQITSGAFWMVSEGTTYGGSQWKVNTPDPIVVGTTALTINQFAAAGTTYTGTTNRVTVTGGAIDISAAYVGQSSITTLGTVTTGVWNGTAVPVANGGTGATAAGAARTNLSSTANALPQKFTQTYTTAIVAGTPFTITHNLNTQDVTVSVRNTATNEHEDFLVIANAVNTITLTSDVAYASPSYAVTVIG